MKIARFFERHCNYSVTSRRVSTHTSGLGEHREDLCAFCGLFTFLSFFFTEPLLQFRSRSPQAHVSRTTFPTPNRGPTDTTRPVSSTLSQHSGTKTPDTSMQPHTDSPITSSLVAAPSRTYRVAICQRPTHQTRRPPFKPTVEWKPDCARGFTVQ